MTLDDLIKRYGFAEANLRWAYLQAETRTAQDAALKTLRIHLGIINKQGPWNFHQSN